MLKSDENNLYHSTFLIITRSFILRMRNVPDKSCRENEKHVLRSVTFSENRDV